jgi:hypothetical protein
MKGFIRWTQNKIVLSTIALIMLSNCAFNKCNTLFEGSDARDAMESTVKIYMKITGVRKNIISTFSAPADGTEETMSWTGSGVVVENDEKNNQSLIMSVAHVTHGENMMLKADEGGLYIFVVTKKELKIEKLNGETCEASPIIGDTEQDLSVISSKCIAGAATPLADELPPVGANVMVSGAALGYHPKNIFIVTDGRYMGIDEKSGEEIITLPAAPGHSGSGIFYRGKVVGLLSKRTVAYEHITICVSLENAKKMLDTAENIWKLQKV